MYIMTNPVNQELFKNFETAKSRFKNNSDVNKNQEEKINLPVLASTATGILAALLFIRKYQAKSLEQPFIKLSESIGIKAKLNAVKKNIISFFNIKTELKEIAILGGGSILGGLAGGIATDDDKNTKNKLKEALYQFINIIIPASFVTGLSKIAENYKLNKTPATIGAAIIGIGIGIPAASFIANKINNFDENNNQKYERSIKLKDGIMHIDDIIAALIMAKVPLANKLGVDKILPLLYLIPGHEAGKQK